MTDILLACILFLAMIDTAVVLHFARRFAEKEEAQRAEDKAEAEMIRSASAVRAETEEEREARERRGSFDEGFDNIMRFAVNGMTGFEREGR